MISCLLGNVTFPFLERYGMCAHNLCNPSTWMAEAGGLQVQDQPGLKETLSKKKNMKL